MPFVWITVKSTWACLGNKHAFPGACPSWYVAPSCFKVVTRKWFIFHSYDWVSLDNSRLSSEVPQSNARVVSCVHSLYIHDKTFPPESIPVRYNESMHPMHCISYNYFPNPVDPCATPSHQDTGLDMVSRLWLGCPVRNYQSSDSELSSFWHVQIFGQVWWQLYLPHCLLHLPVGSSILGHSRDFRALQCRPSDHVHWEIRTYSYGQVFFDCWATNGLKLAQSV